jgi:hypothetical protein
VALENSSSAELLPNRSITTHGSNEEKRRSEKWAMDPVKKKLAHI